MVTMVAEHHSYWVRGSPSTANERCRIGYFSPVFTLVRDKSRTAFNRVIGWNHRTVVRQGVSHNAAVQLMPGHRKHVRIAVGASNIQPHEQQVSSEAGLSGRVPQQLHPLTDKTPPHPRLNSEVSTSADTTTLRLQNKSRQHQSHRDSVTADRKESLHRPQKPEKRSNSLPMILPKWP